MKGQIVVITVYAVILFIGGLMGYLKAGSLVSLVMGTTCALLALAFAAAVWKGFTWGRWAALGLAAFLFLFFGYRYLGAQSFFPGGFMALISLLASALLVWGRSICCSCPSRK